MTTLVRPRNDVGQYDDLREEWWKPRGAFAMLHWIAKARASLIPKANRPGAVLVDVGTGGGLLSTYVKDKGYCHVGVDLSMTALQTATAHGVLTARVDAHHLPFASGSVDVVAAGEILEHVTDMAGVIGEACRILRPGGHLVIDTIADTYLARLIVVDLAEKIPGAAPHGLHDPALFVSRKSLVTACRQGGVEMTLNGLRPSLLGSIAYLLKQRDEAAMVKTRLTSVLFQGVGTKI